MRSSEIARREGKDLESKELCLDHEETRQSKLDHRTYQNLAFYLEMAPLNLPQL